MENNKEEIKEDKISEVLKQNKELADRLKVLEQGGKIILDEVKEETVRVKKIDDKYVVGFDDTITEKKDTDGKKVLMMNVRLKDKGKTINKRVSCLDVANAPVETVKILEKKTKEETEIQGYVDATNVEQYKSVKMGYKVPVKITTTKNFYVIKLDGEKIELEDKFINI